MMNEIAAGKTLDFASQEATSRPKILWQSVTLFVSSGEDHSHFKHTPCRCQNTNASGMRAA